MAHQNENNTHMNDSKAPTLWGWPTYLSIGIAVIILIFTATMVDLRKIWHEITACDKRFVVIGALAHYATYMFRGMRWRRCLIHLPMKAGNGKFALLVFFYNFVDNLVPAKLGDVYAAHLARINFRIRRSAALGSIVFLRMIDAWIILMLACLASWMLFSDRLPSAVIWSLIGGGIIGFGDFATGGQALWGDLLALAGAFAGAIYLLLGRNLRRKLSLLSYAALP